MAATVQLFCSMCCAACHSMQFHVLLQRVARTTACSAGAAAVVARMSQQVTQQTAAWQILWRAASMGKRAFPVILHLWPWKILQCPRSTPCEVFSHSCQDLPPGGLLH